MRGRNPHEAHRAATPLELLFDLTFATSFNLAAHEFASVLAAGHYTSALVGFGFASFAICWAWVNFSWFSSAYDTDDWIFRLVTMLQMIGVLVLAAGLPRMFLSFEQRGEIDNSVMVLGYVIMRVALVFQWLRASRDDPGRRRVCLTYAVTVSIAQAGWVLLVVFPLSAAATIIVGAVLMLVEFMGPILAERQDGGTPWHAHHIAERHGLFAIVALGEGIVGTVAALAAVVAQQGWTLDAALVGLAGTGLTFGMWWVYFLVPSADILSRHRQRALVWSYGQVLIVCAIVATGAGIHLAAYFIDHKAQVSAITVVLAVALPVIVFLGLLHTLHWYLVRRLRPLDAWLLIASSGIAVLSVVASLSGASVAACLVVLMLAPFVTVVVNEVVQHQRQLPIVPVEGPG
jgi:low temperature requirement protein LtrA